jgi:hypothetical protein
VKPLLTHPTRALERLDPWPRHADDLVQDLELETLVEGMARGDPFVADVARHALLAPLKDEDVIAYRQAALRDALAHPGAVRGLYALATAALERADEASWTFTPRQPSSVVYDAREVLTAHLASLRELRNLADTTATRQGAARLTSPAFAGFFERVRRDFPDEELRELERHLEALRFRGGVRARVSLGTANKGGDHRLRLHRARGPGTRAVGGWWPLASGRLALFAGRPNGARHATTATIRIESGSPNALRALESLRDHCLERTAEALQDGVDRLTAFFGSLRSEVAFYLGAICLAERLQELGVATCLPESAPASGRALAAEGLVDPCLALRAGVSPVGNDVAADGIDLLLVTGANQGGKSTFLRALGVAQLLLQAGLFVPARAFRAALAPGVFSHFRREEDRTMTRGRLDEELARLRAIADDLVPGSLLLLNESFAATNEREGSEIARQVIDALTQAGVRVAFVTHLDEFARGRHAGGDATTRCLVAERRPDGTRTFRLREGRPSAPATPSTSTARCSARRAAAARTRLRPAEPSPAGSGWRGRPRPS